jgi:hypothetical protein
MAATIYGALRRRRNNRKYGAKNIKVPTATPAIIEETQIGPASAEVQSALQWK